ncbi:MAG: PAS domain S-box protein [Methanomassiliicoccales archaeon]|nr:PAS domain S-box protein [Methanomassiliicoccales archaeon]
MIEGGALKSNKQIEAIFNNLKEHVIYQDKEKRIIWLNKAAADSAGKPQDELIGRFCYEIWHHRTAPCENCPVSRAIEDGISCSGEIMTPDGRWWAITGWPMKDDEGNIIGAIELTLEISELKEKEVVLRRSEERYRTIFENTGTATMIVDEDMRILLANEEVERLTGYSKKEMEGRLNITDIIAVEERERIAERHTHVDWDKVMEFHRGAPRRHEFNLLTKKGEIKECEMIVSPIPGTKESVISIIDVTELKRTTKELKEMAEEHMMLLDNIDTMVWYATDPETYGLVNRARAEFLGRKKEEIIGRKLREIIPKEICERCIEGNKKAFSGEKIAQEEWMPGPDGKPRCIWVTKMPRFGEDGTVERIFCTGTDITHQKDMENALRLANLKLNLLFRLTRHDILNQLAVIQGYLDLIRMPSNKIPLDHCLDKIEHATRRIGEHLEFTKEMEDLGKEAPVWMKLIDPIEKALSQLDFEGIDVHIDEKLRSIFIFSDSMIWKVFYNLMHNTLKHAKTATRISISANISDDELNIIYEDNGPGIKKQRGENIFESSLVRGGGKGLYLIKDILSINNMHVEEIGMEGVKFVIHVPPHRFKAYN